jgi:energy-coupling factor transporter transmembrane protein EcfT
VKRRKTLLGMVPLESPLYQFHPLTRLIGLVVLAVLPLFVLMPEANLVFLAALFVLFAYARVDISRLRIYLPLMLTVAFFMFTITVLAPDRRPDDIRLQVLGVTVYYQPLMRTLASYIRIMAMLFATIFYFSTNHERDMLVALRAARVPFAVSYVLGLSLRSAAMFLEDLTTVRQAEQARGLDDSVLSIKDKLKMYGLYLIPLFTMSLRRADEISNALFARGYTISGRTISGGPRPDYVLSQYRFRARDALASGALVVLFVGVAALGWRYGAFQLADSPLNRWLAGALQP